MINNVPVKRVPFYNVLGLILESKLYFNEHINTVLSKVFNELFHKNLESVQ